MIGIIRFFAPLIVTGILLALPTLGFAFELRMLNLSEDFVGGGEISDNTAYPFTQDGSHILFPSFSTTFRDSEGVWMVPLNGSGPARLVSHGLNRLTAQNMDISDFLLTAEDRYVVYWGRFGRSEVELYSKRLDGSEPHQKLSLPVSDPNRGARNISVLPDGQTILYRQTTTATGFDWFTVPADGSSEATRWRNQLPDPPTSSITMAEVRITPDGRHWVYTTANSQTGAVLGIYTVPFDFSEAPKIVSETGGGTQVLAVTAVTNQHVLFPMRPPSTTSAIHVYVKQIGSSNPPKQVSPATTVQNASGLSAFSPDGSRIVIRGSFLRSGASHVWSTTVDGAAGPVLLTPDPAAGYALTTDYSFSPDGKDIVLRGNLETQTTRELYRIPINGSSAPIKLSGPTDPQTFVYSHLVTPDQRLVHFEMRTQENGTAKFVNSYDNPGVPTLLFDNTGLRADGTLHYHPNGRHIFARVQDLPSNNIWELAYTDLEGIAPLRYLVDKQELVGPFGVRSVRFGPDPNYAVITIWNNASNQYDIFSLFGVPTIQPLSDVTTDNSGQTLGPFPLDVSDLETSIGDLEFEASIENTNTLTTGSLQFGGDDTGRFFTIHPQPAVHGSTEITITVRDGAGFSASQAFLFTAEPVFSRPLVTDISAELDEDTAITFTTSLFIAGFFDEDNDPMTGVRIDALPSHGTLTISGEAVPIGTILEPAQLDQLVYTPNANFLGQDSFLWNATDDLFFAENPATAVLTIRPVDDLPELVGAPGTSIPEGRHTARLRAADFPFVDIDSPTEEIRINVLVGPSHGVLEPGSEFTLGDLENQTFLYRFTGTALAAIEDSFRFVYTTGAGQVVGEATFLITIPAGSGISAQWRIR